MIDRFQALLASGVRLLPFGLFAPHCAPVLTYHAVFRNLPDNVSPVDNVAPDWLYRHLSELKKHYRFVSIDELSEARSPRGLAAVTFDDGYKCVFDEALPVFENLNIPFTVFLTTSSLELRPFWRHLVVYIINNGLVAECERHMRRVKKVPEENFFAYLKNPVNHSAIVEAEINEFLLSKNLGIGPVRHLIDNDSYLIDHPLVWYGNHSYRHYVLSSLLPAEQRQEIESAKTYLDRQRHVKTSSVFAPPFGDAQHINQETFNIIRDLGYKGLALNRGRLTTERALKDGIRVIERFSPAEVEITWQCSKNCLKTICSPNKH
jgi:peptidoglycan/xylan/chitin deacetylase (PgdA/CDA1 family)